PVWDPAVRPELDEQPHDSRRLHRLESDRGRGSVDHDACGHAEGPGAATPGWTVSGASHSPLGQLSSEPHVPGPSGLVPLVALLFSCGWPCETTPALLRSPMKRTLTMVTGAHEKSQGSKRRKGKRKGGSSLARTSFPH